MKSVSEALQLVRKHIVMGTGVNELSLNEAKGGVLAEDIYAPMDLPAFDQSNVDGYALGEPGETKSWQLKGEVKAGDAPHFELEQGMACRIFTGAVVPKGSMAVVMQEEVKREGSRIMLERFPEAGEHIRPRGTQIQQGQLALPRGKQLNPAAIGFLSMFGIEKVKLRVPPKVSILINGDELRRAGETLKPGEVYESNGNMLVAALRQEGVEQIELKTVSDDLERLTESCREALAASDFLIVSGGISVGTYDLVAEALQKAGVEQIFHTVAQRPGKPLYFGRSNNCSVFALPGNPSSSLVCYYLYVLPGIRFFRGEGFRELPVFRGKLSHELIKKGKFRHFLRGYYENGLLRTKEEQASFQLKPFASGNCLLILPEGDQRLNQGDEVAFYWLPE